MKAPKGYRLGPAQPIANCCRMVRLCPPSQVGQIVSGFNTNTEELEEYITLKIHPDGNRSIVQRIYPITNE